MMAALVSALIAGSVEDSLATWVPIPVLLSALSLALGLVVLLVKKLFAQSEHAQKERDALAAKAQAERDALTAKKLDAIEATMKTLGDQSHAYVRVDAMGRMGDRFDERISDLRERMKVVEGDSKSMLDRIKEIESTLRRRERE